MAPSAIGRISTESDAMMKMEGQAAERRHRLLLAGKLTLTLIIGFWLVRLIDPEQVSNQLASANVEPLLLALAFLAAQPAVLALRWRLLQASLGPSMPVKATLASVYEASFYNQALPTGIGGDVVRIFRAQRSGISWRVATLGVFLDRIVGLFVLVVLCVAALTLPITDGLDATLLATLRLIAITGVLGLSAFALLHRFAPRRRTIPALGFLVELSAAIPKILSGGSTAVVILLLSLAIHSATIATFWAIGLALRIDLSWMVWLLVVPPVLLASLIPLTVNGWGIREAAILGLLALFMIPAEQALTASLLFGLFQLCVGLFGGLVGLLQPERPKLSNPATKQCPSEHVDR